MPVKKRQAIITQPRAAHLERRQLKFFISNTDTAGTTQYFGYLGSFTMGAGIVPWYIMRLDTTTGLSDYIFGENDYDSQWTARANLPYAQPHTFRGFHDKYAIF